MELYRDGTFKILRRKWLGSKDNCKNNVSRIVAALWDNPYLFIGEEHNTAVGARRRNIHHTGSRVSCGNAVRDL